MEVSCQTVCFDFAKKYVFSLKFLPHNPFPRETLQDRSHPGLWGGWTDDFFHASRMNVRMMMMKIKMMMMMIMMMKKMTRCTTR